jgi:WD40 repeat protein
MLFGFTWVADSSVQPQTGLAERECSLDKVLRDHPYSVTCIAWSPDDKLLITTSEDIIKLWNVKVDLLPIHTSYAINPFLLDRRMHART